MWQAHDWMNKENEDTSLSIFQHTVYYIFLLFLLNFTDKEGKIKDKEKKNKNSDTSSYSWN